MNKPNKEIEKIKRNFFWEIFIEIELFDLHKYR